MIPRLTGHNRGGGGRENFAFPPHSSFLSFPIVFMMAAAINVPLGRVFFKKNSACSAAKFISSSLSRSRVTGLAKKIWRPTIFLSGDKLVCSLTTVLRRVMLFREVTN